MRLARGVLGEVGHGVALKGIAMVSRLGFLLGVAPNLVSGELSEYVYLGTIALLLGRVLSFGVDEQLPLAVGGNRERAGPWSRLSERILVVQIFALVVCFLMPSDVLIVWLLTLCYVNLGLMGGQLRTVRITGAERLRDLHWVLFLAGSLALSASNASTLLMIMAASLVLVQLLEAVVSRIGRLSLEGNGLPRLGDYTTLLSLSWKKLVAGAILILILRAVVVWPRGLGLSINLDALAYALLIGEAFWQTAMVLVHRRYARYCALPESGRGPSILGDLPRTSMLIGGYTLVAALAVLGLAFGDVSIAGFADWVDTAQVVVFFGIVTAFLLIRYALWVIVDFSWNLTLLEALTVVGQVIAIATLPMMYWPSVQIALVSVLLFFAWRLCKNALQNVH
ncbi:MAG: hypothetical protein AAFR75_01860 [Pseudomonadota bacterium]